MSGIRTAETRNIRENAEEVPEMVVCPALEQQKLQKTVRMICAPKG